MRGHLTKYKWYSGWSTEVDMCYLNYLHLSCQNENFLIVNILTYEISETTYPIELKFSGMREGVNKLAVLKFQSNPKSLRKNLKNMEFWEISTIGMSYGLV